MLSRRVSVGLRVVEGRAFGVKEQGRWEGFLKKVGLECKSAPLSGPAWVLAAGSGLPCCCDGVWESAGSLSSSSRRGSLSLAAR